MRLTREAVELAAGDVQLGLIEDPGERDDPRARVVEGRRAAGVDEDARGGADLERNGVAGGGQPNELRARHRQRAARGQDATLLADIERQAGDAAALRHLQRDADRGAALVHRLQGCAGGQREAVVDGDVRQTLVGRGVAAVLQPGRAARTDHRERLADGLVRRCCRPGVAVAAARRIDPGLDHGGADGDRDRGARRRVAGGVDRTRGVADGADIAGAERGLDVLERRREVLADLGRATEELDLGDGAGEVGGGRRQRRALPHLHGRARRGERHHRRRRVDGRDAERDVEQDARRGAVAVRVEDLGVDDDRAGVARPDLEARLIGRPGQRDELVLELALALAPEVEVDLGDALVVARGDAQAVACRRW